MLSFYNSHMSTLPPSILSIKEYEGALRQKVRQFDKVYVVVDALDGCRDDDND